MIVPLKRKYAVYKPAKKQKANGDHNNKAQKKKGGPKTYTYGSRVMLLDLRQGGGHTVMVNAEDV